jgi:hypothetical protein
MRSLDSKSGRVGEELRSSTIIYPKLREFRQVIVRDYL